MNDSVFLNFESLVNKPFGLTTNDTLTAKIIIEVLSADLAAIDITLISKNFSIIDNIADEDTFFTELSILCRDKTYAHPEWGLLSGRIKMLRIKRIAPKTFSESCKLLKPVLGENYYNFCMLHRHTLDTIIDLKVGLDWIFDIFAAETLARGYLSRIKDEKSVSHLAETPQFLYLRIAAFLWYPEHDIESLDGDTLQKIKQCYMDLSTGRISPPSPLQFNAGMKRPQLASCFLLSVEDSMQSLSKNWHDSAIISQNNGGIGTCLDSVRHSEIGNHGWSQGITPWVKIINEILSTVNQSGKRKGSGAMYLTDWHRDIFEFVDLKNPIGKEELRARDLFYGIMVSDLFMRRVAEDGVWSTFCPAKSNNLEKTYGKVFEKQYLELEKRGLKGDFPHTFKQVRARDLWKHIIKSQITTGMPYIIYKDAVNRKSNQKHLGTLRLSNLCVAGDTFILTSKGQIQIGELVDQKVEVWNGKEWSGTTVRQTSLSSDLLKITTSDGTTIECTPEHKFYTQKTYHATKPVEVKANELKEGMKLIKFELPEPIEFEHPEDFLSPYTHGFFCGDGCEYPSQAKNSTDIFAKAYLYGEKKELLPYLEYTSKSSHKILSGDILTTIILSRDIERKFVVPHRSSIPDRLRWFEGLCDADGCIARNGTNESIQVASIHIDFLNEVKLMLQTLGIHSKVAVMNKARQSMMPDGKGGMALYDCKTCYRLLVTSNGLHQLKNIGFDPKRLKFEGNLPQRNAAQFIKIVSIEKGAQDVPTFCFTESKRHMGMFNGILTGQCCEIVEYVDKNNIASCNLSSIPVSAFVKSDGKTGSNKKLPYFDFEELGEVTRRAIRNLGQVINRNYYPEDIPEIKYTNFRNRPIGIGIQDLAGCFALLDICWDSDEAKELNEGIARTMYYHGMDENVKMAEEYGAHASFPGSPASQGLFQFDLWDIEETEKKIKTANSGGVFNFDDKPYFLLHTPKDPRFISLRERMMRHGLYFGMLFAQMPTASSAHIRGNNESVEPYTQLLFSRTVLSGQFVICVPHLVRDLEAIGMWNNDILKHLFAHQGSIQNFPIGDDLEKSVRNRMQYLKKKYRTAFELSQRITADLYLDRARYQCQSSSNNLFMKNPTATSVSAYHFYMWRGGAKTGMYYLRQTAGSDPLNFSVDNLKVTSRKSKEVSVSECTIDCLSCHS